MYFLKCFQTVWLMHMHLLVAACLVMFTMWKFEDFSFTHCNLLGRLQKYTKAFEMAKMAVLALINSQKMRKSKIVKFPHCNIVGGGANAAVPIRQKIQ